MFYNHEFVSLRFFITTSEPCDIETSMFDVIYEKKKKMMMMKKKKKVVWNKPFLNRGEGGDLIHHL